MKYIIALGLLSCILFTGCKDNKKTEDNIEKGATSPLNTTEELITIQGNFIYFEDAAVLQTQREIYGVVMDNKMQELADLAKPHQTIETDMVKATVKVRRFEKQPEEEGWQHRVEIKDILKVEPLNNSNNSITIQ